MGSKIAGIPIWAISGLPLGVLGQKAIWISASWRGAEYTLRGKVVISPKSGPW